MAKAERRIVPEGTQPTIHAVPTAIEEASMRNPTYQAYKILQAGFTVAPIVAGLDKFFHVLTNWDQYVAPIFPSLLGIQPNTFMRGVGVIEIIAGIGVAVKPRIFGYVVSGWLGGIILNLLIKGEYFDIALRDLGLALGAFALARLAQRFDRKSAPLR